METLAYLLRRLRAFRDELRQRCPLVHLPTISTSADAASAALAASPPDPSATLARLLERIRAYRTLQRFESQPG